MLIENKTDTNNVYYLPREVLEARGIIRLFSVIFTYLFPGETPKGADMSADLTS